MKSGLVSESSLERRVGMTPHDMVMTMIAAAQPDLTVPQTFAEPSAIDMAGQLFFLLFAFAFVVALAYFSTKWIASAKQSRRGGNLRFLESMSIGQQSAVLLIRAGKKTLLLGVTKESVSLLSELDEDSLIAEEPKEGTGGAAFERQFRRFFLKEKAKEDGRGSMNG